MFEPDGRVTAGAPVALLDCDPGLAVGIDDRELPLARRYARAETVELSRGEHEPAEVIGGAPLDGLLIEGFILRTVVLGGRRCAVLLGPGASLRPLARGGRFAVLPCELRWRAVQSARVALLGRPMVAVAARWPSVMTALVGRGAEQFQLLSVIAAIYSLQHIDLRLHSALWLYARAWGIERDDGVELPVALSHRDLAELAASQRPSVSAALADLARRELVVRCPDRTWLLRGSPPTQFSDLRVRSDHDSGVPTGDSV